MHTTLQKRFSRIAHVVHIARHTLDGNHSREVVDASPRGDSLLLRDKEYLHIQHAAGWIVTSLHGSLWITQDGDLRDIVLHAGESFVLDRKGPAMVSAFGEARVCIAREAAHCAGQPSVDTSAATVRAGRAAFA